jgi:GNAT superfamily N-acetyltransferase
MLRRDMANLPYFPFPPGYTIRGMRLADAGLWEDIWRDTERFLPIPLGLFENQFGKNPDEILKRCYIIADPRGVAAATISAWTIDNVHGQNWGRIHWVATRPAYQGKGLAKAGMSYAMRQLALWHPRAMLDTSTGRMNAIKIYLDFGFVPDFSWDWSKQAWEAVRQATNHPALKSLRYP